jgi:hypothetical protein
MTYHISHITAGPNRNASTPPSFARFGIPFLFLTIASVYEAGTPEQLDKRTGKLSRNRMCRLVIYKGTEPIQLSHVRLSEGSDAY